MLQEVVPKPTPASVIKLVKSNEFWKKLVSVVKDIEFPSNVIRKLEADDSSLSLVYHYFGEIYNHFDHDKSIQEKVMKRLKFLFTEATGLAYMLTPKYASKGFYFDEDQTDIMGFAKNFAEKIHPEAAEKVVQELISFVTKISTLPQNREEIVFK